MPAGECLPVSHPLHTLHTASRRSSYSDRALRERASLPPMSCGLFTCDRVQAVVGLSQCDGHDRGWGAGPTLSSRSTRLGGRSHIDGWLLDYDIVHFVVSSLLKSDVAMSFGGLCIRLPASVL